MANLTAKLVRICKTPEGWRRYPVVIGKNGRIRPGYVSVGNRLEHFPVGRYEIRKFEGKKPVYTSVGEDATDALNALHKEKQLLAAKHLLADVPTVQLVEEPGRAILAKQLQRCVTAAKDRGAMVAADSYQRCSEEFLLITGRVYVDQIVADDLTDYHKTLRKRGISDRTIHNHHMNVTSFLRFCGLDIKKLAPRAPRYDKTMPEIYEDDELATFFASLTTLEDRVFFELLLQTGSREQEAMYLEWSDIKQTRTLHLHSKPKYAFKMKDHEERELPLSHELYDLLLQLREKHPNAKLVFETKNSKPNTKLLLLVKRRVRRAGLNCGLCAGCIARGECERWFLHKFRATYCTKLLRAGMDLRTVQQMMGHSDLASTMRYLRPAENTHVQERVNQINWYGSATVSAQGRSTPAHI